MQSFLLFFLNFGLFAYVLGSSAILIVSRWLPNASLFPWQNWIAHVLETHVLTLTNFPQFIGLLVLPSCVFMLLQLRGIVKNESSM